MRITIRPSSSFIRDPEASAGHIVPAFAVALSVRTGCKSRELGPWRARDGLIVTPQGSRAVLMHLGEARALVSEISFTLLRMRACFSMGRAAWRHLALLLVWLWARSVMLGWGRLQQDGLPPALRDLCRRGSIAVIA